MARIGHATERRTSTIKRRGFELNVDLFCPCCALLVILQIHFLRPIFAPRSWVFQHRTRIFSAVRSSQLLSGTPLGFTQCTGLESREILAFVVRVALLQCLLDELEARRLRVTSGRVFRMLTGAIPQET